MKISMIRLVAFDLDGTLVDSHRDIADATNALLQELGAAPLPDEVITTLVGEGAGVLVRRALERSGLTADLQTALERYLVHYDARLLNTTRPYPGMAETLADVGRTRRLAVLTNKPLAASIRVLEGLGMLDAFAEVVGGDSVHGRKPDPAGLRALIMSAGVSKSETLLVGDSPFDLATAQAAGAHVCLARYGFGYRFDPADLDGSESIIDDPRELLERLEVLDSISV